MDSTDSSLESKCENMMYIVVESRKRFGKMSVDYEHKTSLLENKILNLQIETFNNCRFKSKCSIPKINKEDYNELEKFSAKTLERSKRINDLNKKIKNTREVVSQLKSDSLGKRLREPLTADFLLTKAKDKQVT